MAGKVEQARAECHRGKVNVDFLGTRLVLSVDFALGGIVDECSQVHQVAHVSAVKVGGFALLLGVFHCLLEFDRDAFPILFASDEFAGFGQHGGEGLLQGDATAGEQVFETALVDAGQAHECGRCVKGEVVRALGVGGG